MSLVKLNGSAFTKDSCLSLAGATNTDVIPLALKTFLERNKNINTIVFHLDNDIVSFETTEKLMSTLSDSYTCINRPPLHGKDVNEELQIHVRKMVLESGKFSHSESGEINQF